MQSMTDTRTSDDFSVEAVNRMLPGGQQVGTTYCGVKVTHLPTGIYAVCDYERSQHKNRTIAMRMVEYGLAEIGWKK